MRKYGIYIEVLTTARMPDWQFVKVQQGLEIRGFWFQKKTVQLKTALREVYTYVLNGIFFSKNSATSRL